MLLSREEGTMQKKLAELVDVLRLQRLMDALYEAVGIPSGIIDKDLNVLTKTGWQDICIDFHRMQPETLQNCKESDDYIRDNLHKGSYFGYQCKNGMLDYACPIVIEEQHMGTLFIGQFFLAPPQEEYFLKQAKKYGFDEEKYMAALRKVPVIKKEQMDLILIFFVELANLIAEMATRNFKQLEVVTFLEALMNAIPNPIYYKDIKGIYQGCNHAFAEFLGIPREKIIGSSVYDLSPYELAVKYEAMDSDLFHNPRVQIYEYEATNLYGEKRQIIFNKAPYLNSDQQIAGLVGIMVDITRKKELEIALKNSEIRYRSLFNTLLDGFVYFENIVDDLGNNVDYRIIEVNLAFEKITGVSKEELIGKKMSETVFGPQNTDMNCIDLVKEVCGSGKPKNVECFSTVLNKWFLVSAYSPQSGCCAIIISDITQQKENIKRAQYDAYHDSLTGLPNRRLVDDRLSLAIAQGKRTEGKIAIVFLDLDKFKEVNDSFGHEGGDILLKEVAQRFITCIRDGDTASRLGGDEFLLILPNLKNYDEASNIVTRILEVCKQPFQINQHTVEISASLGVSFFPQDGDNITSLMRNADLAMYRCKEEGRNGVCYFTRLIS